MHIYSLYICDKIIRVESECGGFIRFCRGYIIKEPSPIPDYVISISREEINAQRSISDACSTDLLEGFVLLKKLENLMLNDEGILLMHGSVVVHRNSAYMFTASSGVGKTTHSRLWIKNLPNAYILNGDKPFISTQNSIVAWGSPWCGSEGFNKNQGVELKAICLIRREENNSISEISFEEALPELALQTGNPNPNQYETKIQIIKALYRLKDCVKFFDLRINNFKDDAFLTSYQAISKL